MTDRDVTFLLYGPGGQAPPAVTTGPVTGVIPSNLDMEITQIHRAAESTSGTGPIRDLKGGSEELRASMPDPLFGPPRPAQSRENFVTLAKWRGRVVEINGSTFRAFLSPIIGGELPKEAEIYFEDISPEDRHLVKGEAAFYWSVGYLDRPSGRIRASLLRFTRGPQWSSRDIAEAKAQAKRYLDLFSG